MKKLICKIPETHRDQLRNEAKEKAREQPKTKDLKEYPEPLVYFPTGLSSC